MEADLYGCSDFVLVAGAGAGHHGYVSGMDAGKPSALGIGAISILCFPKK